MPALSEVPLIRYHYLRKGSTLRTKIFLRQVAAFQLLGKLGDWPNCPVSTGAVQKRTNLASKMVHFGRSDFSEALSLSVRSSSLPAIYYIPYGADNKVFLSSGQSSYSCGGPTY